MTNKRATSETLNEALAHLNEAAKESRDEIRKLVDERYTNLKHAFGSAARATGGWVKDQGMEAADTAKLTAGTVDKSVRQYPWAYIGGAAATGFLVGLLASRRK